LCFILLSLSLLNDFGKTFPAVSASSKKVIKCKVDDDCLAFNTYFTCQNITVPPKNATQNATIELECAHKSCFPMYPKEAGGAISFVAFKMLSTVGGIGGGGVTAAFAIYFFQLDTKPAVALSSFAIMISTWSAYVFNFNMKHPEKPNVIMLDYNITIVMMPLVLLGSLIGAYFLIALPDLAI